MPRVINIAGQQFGKWTVLEKSKRKDSRASYWLCKCDCGTLKNVESGTLRNGRSKSCGCSWSDFVPTNKREEGEAAFNSLYSSYRVRAAAKGRSFALTKQEFRFFTSQDCFYCGMSPSNETKYELSSQYRFNGIDRLDSAIGYEVKNCVSCCKQCNYAKRDMDVLDFLTHIQRIANHNRGAA